MRRFYDAVSVRPEGDNWRVFLDERPIRTPGGSAQVLPTQALAQALADEWARQGEELDVAQFVLRDLADFAVDMLGTRRDAIIGDILAYAETDTLCYRGDEDEPLHARQLEVWEPLLCQAEKRFDVHFERVNGIIHASQSGETLARMRAVLEAHGDFTLAGVQMLASLSASLVTALAAIEPGADSRALWNAANLEEEWQAELWGRDAEAEATRAMRFEAFAAAMRFTMLARSHN